MRAAVLVKSGEIALEERDSTPPASHEVEIAVKYVGICGSDQARFDGRVPAAGPVVFGHECSGRVAAVGIGACGTGGRPLAVGQPVTVAPLLNCGACRLCVSGREHLCPHRRLFGTHVDGALRERVCMPAGRVFPLADDVSLQEGALVEPLAIAVHAVRIASQIEGASAVVLGTGAIGLLIAQVARAFGARDTIAVDIAPARLELAGRLGFRAVDGTTADPVSAALALTGGRGADVVFEATGVPAVGRYFAPMLATPGTVVVVGRMHDRVPLDVDAMMFREARLLTSRYFTLDDFRTAVDLLTSGRVTVGPLIQAVMPFDRLGQAGGRVVMDAARRVARLLVAFDAPGDKVPHD